MLREGACQTLFINCDSTDGALAGGMLADRTGDGVSAVYSFFHRSKRGVASARN